MLFACIKYCLYRYIAAGRLTGQDAGTISFALGSQCARGFGWNMYLTIKSLAYLQDLDKLICVKVPGADGKPDQNFTYSKLMELQSKLMLVAGQNQESTKEIDVFVEVRLLI